LKDIKENGVRPTMLFPIWNVVGFGAGYISGVLGKEAAMAVTVAVEDVIGEHYNSQLRDMLENGYTKLESDVTLKNVLFDKLGNLQF
jgi:ubiquinone biosynthesis monooxygenase Coq7